MRLNFKFYSKILQINEDNFAGQKLKQLNITRQSLELRKKNCSVNFAKEGRVGIDSTECTKRKSKTKRQVA